MTYNPKYNAQKYAYRTEKFKRVGVDFEKEYYENNLKPAADAAGETVGGYIKKAVDKRIRSKK